MQPFGEQAELVRGDLLRANDKPAVKDLEDYRLEEVHKLFNQDAAWHAQRVEQGDNG